MASGRHTRAHWSWRRTINKDALDLVTRHQRQQAHDQPATRPTARDPNAGA